MLCWRIAEAFADFCAQGAWREALALLHDSCEGGLQGMDLPSLPVVPAVLVGVWPCVPAADRRDLLIEWWPRLAYTWPGRDALVPMLRATTGYVGPTARPCAPHALYRGVVDPAHALGLSWSGHWKVARFFSQRFGGRPQAVFRATLRSADALLGYFPQCHEREYVVDPAGLVSVERVRRRPPVHRQPPLPLRPPGVPSRRQAGRDG